MKTYPVKEGGEKTEDEMWQEYESSSYNIRALLSFGAYCDWRSVIPLENSYENTGKALHSPEVCDGNFSQGSAKEGKNG